MTSITWGHDALRLEISDARLTYVGPPGGERHRATLPLLEVIATGHGHHWSSHRLIDTAIGARMRYRRHHATDDVLTVELHDPESGLAAEVIYRSPDSLPVLRSEAILRNEGEHTLILESVTSLVVGGLAVDSTDLLWADNDWLAEYRWQRRPLRLTSQGAVWAYPQPEDSLDEVAFTMISALLGRIHLSGRLADLDPDARALVHEAVAVYKAIRADLPQGVPSWPLGLPGWDDPWVALAMQAPTATYLAVWRRGAEATLRLPYPHRAELLYPSSSKAVIGQGPQLTVTLPTAPSAVLLRLL
ncbi:glycoside hydrolase family 36 N-terminal domain-containing protein [Nonomuraea helvata]|uniref:Glycoside hydrolase family 36 N-terminal domain-containing protein n=1 Tax=Nonomuraea helvata TaxID=37484 RepID=A0ABV5S585_9ACTN